MIYYSLQRRAQLYNDWASTRGWPAVLHADERWLHGVWILGNDYRTKSALHGAYPHTYLDRVHALFPDAVSVLHLCAGSVTPEHWAFPLAGAGREVTLDLVCDAVRHPQVQGDAQTVPFKPASFDLVLVDVPYTKHDAAIYGTPMPSRTAILREAAKVTMEGGYLVWLDTRQPMHRKDVWHWCGFIGVARSGNHLYRGVTIYHKE